MTVDIEAFLAEERDKADEELTVMFLQFEELWSRKLWHQLTESLLEFFNKPQSGKQRLSIYQTFVLSFADKINQLNLVSLGLLAASHIQDKNDALNFLNELKGKVKGTSQEAYVYATVEAAKIKLQLDDFEGGRTDLDESEKILEKFDSVESMVHASFYSANADYYHARQEFASYYKNSLLYLACINIDDLPVADRQARAYLLAVSALAADTIYNFGELLLHPILDSLKGTQHEWIHALLYAFNEGNIGKYEGLTVHLAKEPTLAGRGDFLRRKIRLSALTEAVFVRPPNERALSFATIMKETQVAPDEVEHLLMKALSLGLIRGSIDQVSGIARISWVQPKVLTMQQIKGMRDRLIEWDSGVSQLSVWMENKM
ncbi:26S proteasome regulatory subunit [Orbilia oligospora]|uniref:26S proteasome regulatory subunit n=1 Tax=Orbilia oligospora TaxID=2813651 RepID=A0A6G1MMZ5_ORBOL|nr:26S proteasome regulatory subunit [Orbilia oligospora]KAF3216257.1 26S proteasome regulatory subunit [Orbilia oligospora]KAF3216827.1 26S proteasome regulatory subunit [Orbilia oligospora]KAF3229403.1 26S proteasome regulatory subunit [Orbilia oligospora]KAF3264435.1 26S proteasome regulatory subunit [Orbilia oligospora]